MNMQQIRKIIKDRPLRRAAEECKLPVRMKKKNTRFFIDNEFFAKGYAAKLKSKRVLDVYCVLAKYANAKTQT